MARRVHMIFNPTAGWRRRSRLERVLRRLGALGATVTLRETQARGDAEAIARSIDPAACDAVVAAGGDGTINEVMNGLIGSTLPLGIVPLGTANVFAAEIGLPRDTDAVADAIAQGRPMPVYCGSANGRCFAMMAGIGFDARVVEGIDLRLKRLFGKGAYVASTIAALVRHAATGYRVEIDGAAHDAAAVVIAKGHFYGGRFVVAAQARLDEPLLQVALFGGGGRGDVLRYARALGANRIAAERDMRILPAREVRVTGPAGEAVQIDGDLACALPLVANVVEQPIAILR